MSTFHYHLFLDQSTKKMRQFLSFFIFIVAMQSLSAQTYHGLSGRVVDESTAELVGATVLLLNLPDSIMEEYALTNETGTFKITAPKSSNYLLQISYMGFETQHQIIDLSKKIELGDIILKEKFALLESIEVTEERIPIRMRGDTLEYHADAFETKEHDNVEALLKRLPGVEVGRDGKIKAQGETVDRILVDGKEFFGDNPEVAMKNLPAGAVEKVQVYDRKSEMAEFSGVDDGVKQKTINLKLKKDKKYGFFGHVEGGYGYDVLPSSVVEDNHRYKGNLSLNYFNPKVRISTIGAINNINEQSFNFMDYINLMGGIQSMMSGSGNINLEINEGDPLGALLMGNNDGIAQTIGGGVNFNFFISDKTEWSTHYFYSILNKKKEQNSFTRSINANSYFSQNSWLNSNVQAGNHNINSTFKHEFDPTQDLKFQVKFKFNEGVMGRNTFQESFGSNSIIQNDLSQDYSNKQTGWGINSNVLYRKKFKKKGRVIMSNLVFGYSNKSANNENTSITNLYNDGGSLIMIDSLNQEQTSLENQQVYGAEVSFIEPIGKKNFLDVKLVGMFNFDTKDRNVYDLENEVSTENNLLTNLFQKQYNYQSLTTRFQRSEKPYTLTLEASLQRSYLKGVFSNGQEDIARTYYYPLGVLNFEYKVSKSSSFNFRYNGAIKEPKVLQLQPILNNNSPLALFVGNPNLNPEYHHNFSLRYNLFDQFTFTSLFANISFSVLQNQIVNSQIIDENLRRTYLPQNSAVGYTGRAYLSFSRPIKPLAIKFNLGVNGELAQSTTMVNNIANTRLTQKYTFKASVENRKKKIVDAIVGTEITLNNSTFSINNSLNTTYLNYMGYANVQVAIAKKWLISTDFEYNIYADQAFEEKIYIPMWSAAISRTFMKGDQLKIEFRVSNILDQKLNIYRFSQDEMINEDRVSTIGRYFMLSARFKIMQVGAKKKGAQIDFETGN